ncbi:hypothetical protein A2641_00745 [Candidatus Nomurabacteria bacterium RIFCSPHIGHO2_01_FULL_37_25]|uniref:Uncharacterized protein n=1 Tax=Candidatus Nomurabacteria bacterium RIFCSPLOWO2_01_FULL_36_16 TaxID=1801767 RepID=A0A1F6WXM6_9BACT|nr:MAG: hypothetical protein A2641_00745 [Candidatus Nomurabacteria bacterium RIFCSPHIGHO2_01_FULL_37_25]OGI74925.1 MAG: hypothetical protein A3D36_01350 [Candidatus Nomurabacteria bacterium RIFCSPHIGHO2_02_FULL_36_29]OGI86639.1 MAG: hypothetical protein A3A91_02915 [Candidatus Nomurabacteria bacterium RIFCSPLOWO2_01_FULL_36_16]
MKQKLFTILLISLGIFSVSFVLAQNEASEIVFPVMELGGCSDKAECFAYCELDENATQCLAFAKKYQLLPEEEIRISEKVLGVKGGPGGCNSKASCENYCDDVANIETCVAFAEENGLMKGKDLEEAKKVRAIIQSGKKMPGDCRNKNACENYCQNPDHMEECLAFAEESGFLPPEELEQAKKFMPLMKSGETPGGCKSKDECEAYCESDEHFDECISFAEKHGMIHEEERKHIEAFKKAGGRGPGGCKGRQCQAFCEQAGNQQVCFEWAKENGVLKEDDLRRMEEGRKQIEKVFEDAPPEVIACLEEALGPGGLEKMQSGEFFGGEAMGEKMHTCFEGFMTQMGGDFNAGEQRDKENTESRGDREDFSGPGGCKGPDECMTYCKDHMEECQKFSPPQREMNIDIDDRGELKRESNKEEGANGGENIERNQMMKFKDGEFLPPKDLNQKYDLQYQQEYNQQYQHQFQQPMEEFRTPWEMTPPTSDTLMPNEGSYQIPSGENLQPPPELQPHSRIPTTNILGLVLASFMELFK